MNKFTIHYTFKGRMLRSTISASTALEALTNLTNRLDDYHGPRTWEFVQLLIED